MAALLFKVLGGDIYIDDEYDDEYYDEDDYEYYEDYQPISFGKRVFVPADLNNVLQNLGEQLINMGANAIINLKIDYVKTPYNKTSLNTIIVTGMAIKK